jgi:hypothetical protein
MILRRLTQHIRDQNWFAVGLDFIIVVFGVVIGFQVTDWNEARGEREREAMYLAALVDDLRSEVEEFAVVRRGAQLRMSGISAILTAAGNPPRLEYPYRGEQRQADIPAEFVSDVPYAVHQAATTGATIDAPRHTYRTLISTGEFRLIRDAELARQIQTYYAHVDEVRDLERILHTHILRVYEVREAFGISVIGMVDLAETGQIVAAQPRFDAALRNLFVWSNLHRREIDGLEGEAASLIAALEARNYD